MAAETQTLNFGPEWLRTLSSGGSVTSPPPSPALPKYKLADHRYGREEMLALYIKEHKVPEDLMDKEFLPILNEEPLLPLALVPFTEEEQRNFSMSVNSAAVLRLMGRGGGPVVAGAPRGRGVTRGRGRGRGEPGFYQRSFDEVEGGFGRGAREINRSQSWEERGGDRRFEKPGRRDAPVGAVVPPAPPPPTAVPSVRPVFDEASALLAKKQQHDFTRSDSENWRAMREEANGERWRQSSPDGPRSAGWREPGERPRRRFDFEFRERDEERGGGGAYRRTRSGSGSFDDDNLPEWCLDDEGEMGTFDSSGAFMSFKKGPKEPIPEEQELEFKGADEEDEEADDEGEFRREDAEERQCSRDNKDGEKLLSQDDWDEASLESGKQEDRLSPTQCFSKELPAVTGNQLSLREEGSISHKDPEKMDVPDNQTLQHGSPQDLSSSKAVSSDVLNSVGISGPGSGKRDGVVGHDHDDDEGLKHLEQEAEKMVASLQDTSLEEDRLDTKNRASALPLTHEAAMKWFYKDPQGDIQGPFTNQEMAEWFQAGYFTMTLLVKRGCDEGFQPLGEVIKMWGRVPFAPGPVPPPFLNDPDHERLKRQQELAIIQMQLQYQQFLQAQLYSRQCAQSIAQLQQKATLAPLTPQQQQHLALLIQHYQTLKQRTQEHQQGLIPAVSRSLSVPESTGSLWELKTPTSQPAGWEGGSIWDLPPESQGPTLEQLQQLEREKGGKLLDPERCEAELRMRDDDERKRQEEQVTRTCAVKVTTRRQQEELLQRQEEERKRREEEEAARRKQQQEDEEQLRRQQEQEMLRRQEEKRRREEEERRQREDMIRKQAVTPAVASLPQEEERRHQEEEEARRRCEEDEEKKRKEVELQRQKELQQQQRQQELELQQRQQELELQQRQQDLELQQRQKELQQRQQQEMMRQRQQQEALRRLQQQQLAQMKLPSSSTWGQQVPAMSSQQSSLSLAEIQKIEEEREKQLREEQRRQQDLIKTLQQQQQQQQQKPVGWNNVSKAGLSAKSLLEIQQEEARHVQKQQQQQRAQAQAQAQQHSSVPINNASVWGNVSPGGSSNPWGSDVSNLWGGAGAGTIQEKKSPNIGFWDDAVKELGPPVRNVNMKTSKSSPSLGESYGIPSRQSKKKTEEEDKLMKLFQGVNKAQDGFTQWCEQMLHALNTSNNLDVPTFVSFLKEVESPYEVHDYITAYLGETPDAKEFAKQFLERRAKQKQNHQRQQQQLHQQQQESVWGLPQGGGGGSMPSAYQCGHSAAQQASFEAMQASKKKKKQRMVRADPSILGFSVNASSDRPNMGEIETLED
ncbi:GRB10-interacting GYF protein 2 isoform X3 [Lampetra fluviatilis]